ncbi:ComEA family DNA-binding protein [Fervidobacterium islandicum]|uniref:ComEA family DNA-binding protein n=1 Tax=Fervidobacterium islandicum TaxID=2423 RepID=UPI000A99DDF4|nr:helix-hairpin-helix domain-containing protein [Fervidobacterium islandicum]
MLPLNRVGGYKPNEDQGDSERFSPEILLTRFLEFLKSLHSKLSKEQKTFFLLFSALIVISGVLFNPSYDRLKLQAEGMGGENKTTQGTLQEAQRNYAPSVIDLNTASFEELQTLPGIGPSKARAIIEYRENQAFTKPEDIMSVPGIGQKTYEKLKDRIKVERVEIAGAKNTAGRPQTVPEIENDNQTLQQAKLNQSQTAQKQEQAKININTATSEELQKLPGIGPTKAQAIIDYRTANGPFKTIEEIRNVKGIGEKTFEKLKELITVR